MDALIILLLFFLACGCAIYCALCLREQRRCTLGTGDWAKFYKKVAPYVNATEFGFKKLPRVGPVWITADGKVRTSGMEFVVEKFSLYEDGTYEIIASSFLGGNSYDKINYHDIKLSGKLK